MPNFITSLPRAACWFATVYSRGGLSPALRQFRTAEGPLTRAPRMVRFGLVEPPFDCAILPHRAPMPIFTPHQDSALKAVADWLKAKPGRNGTPPGFRLFGYAGTGKTT